MEGPGGTGREAPLRGGHWALLDQDRDKGVRLLRELSSRKPDYPGLADKLAQAYSGRINDAFEKGQFGYARKILHELETISPKNLIVVEVKNRFNTRAKNLVDDAMKRDGYERVEKLAEALRVWPTFEGAAEKYAEAFKAMPTLDVAVLDLPRPAAPWVRSPAAVRVTKLLYLPILADESEDAVHGKNLAQLASGLETSEIGKKLDIKLRQGPVWSDGTRPVGAIDVVRALSDRAQPRSPGYSARWADLLDRVEITDEQQVSVRLTRPVLRPESWLLKPVGPAHAAWDGRVSSADGKRQPVGDGPFISVSESENSAAYHSAPANATAKVKRIKEVRMKDASEALGALVRGEVTMVERVAPDRVPALRQEAEIKVGTYNHPSLHCLALDGRNPVLRNRSIRRGLAYAIDRRLILEENILHRATDEANTPSDGPFATDSYANAAGVKPYPYDLGLSRMLIAAGKTEMKIGPIKLTLEYPAIPEAQVAAPRLAEMLRDCGVEIALVERPESELEEASVPASGSTWRIVPTIASNPSTRSARSSAPATTPRATPRPWPRSPARGSCSSSCSWNTPRN